MATENLTEKKEETKFQTPKTEKKFNAYRPTPAFIGASWTALLVGMTAYCIGLWNSNMELNEQGYYFTLLLFGLFSAVSVQKSVRDRAEGIQVTDAYYGISWFAVLASILLIIIGLWNAEISKIEKGFYAMSYCFSLFSAIAVQKNIRDNNIISCMNLP